MDSPIRAGISSRMCNFARRNERRWGTGLYRRCDVDAIRDAHERELLEERSDVA
jgi:hypothetical protein